MIARPFRAMPRPFRIEVRRCRRCDREWPGYLSECKECAAALGEARLIPCERLSPRLAGEPGTPYLAVVLALELSRRNPSTESGWAADMWAAVAPRIAAPRITSGPAGSIVAAWPLESNESVVAAAELALDVRALLHSVRQSDVELRGSIVLGVSDGMAPHPGRVERISERMALAAASGQLLVTPEVVSRIQDRFELRPAGIVARWRMPDPGVHRALVTRLVPPVLPSAVRGEAPAFVLGRDTERRRLLATLRAAASGRRRVLLVCAPAGGGKSYLLRRVLADGEVELAAGIAFSPLGSHPLAPVRRLLTQLGSTGDETGVERLGETLARAAEERARIRPVAIVIDDLHWASRDDLAALHTAIAASDRQAPLAWILSARTAALPSLVRLLELVDVTVEPRPLKPQDRVALLAHRLGEVGERVARHVVDQPERGNPLYLEHLAASIAEGTPLDVLPGSLHEAVLTRLDAIIGRAHRLAHWTNRRFRPEHDLEALEEEVSDWLDRLETSDIADLSTIGRYLARLRAVDFELVVARGILRMPIVANRRLAQAIERLSAASTDALLDYLADVADDGQARRAADEAETAADRAELALRLSDAERLIGFACRHDPRRHELERRRGDLALALGRPGDALEAYQTATPEGDPPGELLRRIARCEALLDHPELASARLESLLSQEGLAAAEVCAAGLDLARINGRTPSLPDGRQPAGLRRQEARAEAWADPGASQSARRAASLLVLSDEPAACAAELIDTAAICRLAGVEIGQLQPFAEQAARLIGSTRAIRILETTEVDEGRRTFLHWEA